MCSAFVNSLRGLGTPMTEEELAGLNAWRHERGRGPLKHSPGLR